MGLLWSYNGPMTSIHVRLPDDLHEALKATAKRNGISLNAVISLALRGWMDQQREEPNGPQK